MRQIGYKQPSIITRDYLTSGQTYEALTGEQTGILMDITNIIETIRFPQHPASDIVPASLYTQKFQDICTFYKTICTKIVFKGELSPYNEYVYMASIGYIISQVDAFTKVSGLPKISDTLKSITINGAWWDRRGGSTRDTMIINTDKIANNGEFFEVFSHELGHVFDLGMMQWVSTYKDKNFTEFAKVVFATDDISLQFYELSRKNESTRLLTSKQDDFCSGYGMTDPFEDIAECFNLYTNHNAYFKKIALSNTVLASKYNFFANIMNWYYIFGSTTDLTKLSGKKLTRRAWDTTRMW